jgi:hypothetical protein
MDSTNPYNHFNGINENSQGIICETFSGENYNGGYDSDGYNSDGSMY